jgi:ribosome-associated protein
MTTPIELRGEYITLAQAVKAAGLAETGGQAKHLVRAGLVRVNGEAEDRPGRKLRAGDRVTGDGREWIIQA